MVGNAQDLLGRMFLNGCKWSQKHFYLQISSVDDQIFLAIYLSGIDGIYSYILSSRMGSKIPTILLPQAMG